MGRGTLRAMKFHTPSFFLGAILGIVATFAVLNGGACRPSPTPTDDDDGTHVGAPLEPSKPAADVPIGAPAVPPAAPVPALAPIKVEVQVEGAQAKPAEVEVPAGAVIAAPVSQP